MEVRPRFQHEVALPQAEVLARFEQALSSEDVYFKGHVVDHHITIKIPADDQHFWSPQLSLEVEAREEGCLIRGLFGPRPTVWLMFVFFYAALGFGAMIVSIIGFSQWSLDLSAGILWLLPVAAFLAGMVYLSARTGQKLGREETRALYNFMEQVVTLSSSPATNAPSTP